MRCGRDGNGGGGAERDGENGENSPLSRLVPLGSAAASEAEPPPAEGTGPEQIELELNKPELAEERSSAILRGRMKPRTRVW